MTPIEDAFIDADFNWVMSLQNIWVDSPHHVSELHEKGTDLIMRDFRRLGKRPWSPVLGKVIVGPPGSGKTHLIGDLRRRVWDSGGWFVFLDIVGITDFWQTVVLGFIESLRQPLHGLPQYEHVFKATLKTIDPAKAKSVALDAEDLGEGAAATVNLFVKLLKVVHPQGQQFADVVRALLLQRDPDTMDIAYAWLQGLDVPETDRAKLGLVSPPPSPIVIVRGISWLMSLSGPTMIAIDQIDSIVMAGNIARAGGDSAIEAKAKAIIELFAGGLMDLSNQAQRSMTVLSCFTETWEIIATKTMKSVSDRFGLPVINLTPDLTTSDVAASIIRRRLDQAYAESSERPPSQLWPFNAAFCREVQDRLPRQVLVQCDHFRLACLGSGRVAEWPADGDVIDGGGIPDGLDEKYAELRKAIEIPAKDVLYFDEGNLLGELLKDSLLAYTRHLKLPDDVDAEITEDPASKPVLHVRLKFIFLSEQGLEKHFCFRVLGHKHARAFQARLAAAITASGIDEKLPFRHLFVLRSDALPGGRVTADLKARFEAAGGVFHDLTEEDLRSLLALRDMLASKSAELEKWLRERQPYCETAIFKAIGLCPPPIRSTEIKTGNARRSTDQGTSTKSDDADARSPDGAQGSSSTSTSTSTLKVEGPLTFPDRPAIPLGPRLQGGLGPVEALPLANLTRHTALFAGSGSGKTVLLRRIVEEAALAGIPAIVLDTNNDLARLGQAWPQRPASFTDEDAAKAARYARDVEVVVWTPGVGAGRPLTLAVLPDFSTAAEGEEREAAVAMAWSTLAPLVGASGAARVPKEGLLKEALTAFAREGRVGIEAFIDFLADLPDGVSKQTKAQKYGVEISDQLRGKIAVNPLLNAPGQPLDPAVLFTASRAGATRISVVNFSGLEAEASRQDFVNQLQMALFTFIKRHPSATPRLYVCDEAQNFAPSSASTASKASAVALARQGRKFGLGMIFATQGPKGIDTNIVSNCVTHFYGRMSSPALIDATEEMMAAKGRTAKDLGALTAGIFYFATEGTSPVKLKTPLCLSHHPANPATSDEVVALARP